MTPVRRVALGVEAAVLLVATQVRLRWCGPRRLMRVLGRAEAFTGAHPTDAGVWRRARPVAASVDGVADRLPWRAACLVRAVATRAMLRRRDIACELHLGIVGTRPLSAHAWITAGGLIVQGGQADPATALATLR